MAFSNIGIILAAIFYLVAAVAVIARLFHPKGPNLIAVLSLGCAAIVLHTLTTHHFIFEQSSINLALPIVISLVSLVITLTVSAIALKFKVNLLLPVTYGFAGIWQIALLFIPHNAQTPIIIEQFALFSHISLALIAYCILVIATLYVFQVAYINMKLKSKNLAAVSHLPPLMQVESQLFTILAVGTVCLIISELTGVLFLENFISKENAHKTILSVASLALYMWTLWGHYKQGWRGHRVLVLTVTATALLTLAYFGSRFVKEFLL